MAAEVILITALVPLLWTYLGYPALVIILAAIKRNRRTENSEPGNNPDPVLPSVSVLMSVFNEEKVIGEKVASMLASDYPASLQRYITQFLLMNAALAAGFVKAIRGIKNGIWEPTKRV